MTLKPRLDISVTMFLGGLFIAYVFIGSIIGGELYKTIWGLIPGVFGLLGLSLVFQAVAAMYYRSRLAIVIDTDGITLPTGNVFRLEAIFIPIGDIAGISKHASLKGRGVGITLTNGGKVFIQIRQYCPIDKFLSYCKANRYPVVEGAK